MTRTTLLALLLIAAAAAPAPAGTDVEVRVEEIPRGWVTRLAYPLRLSVANGPGGELRTAVTTRGWSITHDASLPAGPRAILETTVVGQRNGSVSWSYAGLDGREGFSYANVGWQYIDGRNPVVTCVDSYLFRELESEREARSAELLVLQMGRDELPRRWQSYIGMVSNLLVEPRVVATLDREQREALSRWVLWLGGSLWLVGKGADEALRALELDLPAMPPERVGSAERHRLFNGFVTTMAESDAAGIVENAAPGRRTEPFAAYYANRDFSASTDWLFESLDGVSVAFIIGSLLLLTVILGPANYLYVRRKKSMLLFYVITPVVACAGTAAIIVGSSLVEGLGARYNQCAVLVRRAGGNDAMLFDLRAVRTGYSVPSLAFPADAFAVPLEEPTPGDSYAMDLTGGLALRGGWLKPRFASGYLTAVPVVSRMNVEIQSEGERHQVVNGLGFTLETVVARLPDGRFGWAAGVPPGERATLTVENGDHRLRQIQNEYERAFGDRVGFQNVTLAARAAGLPYLDDGGLHGRLLHGDYYYLAAGGPGKAEQ